MIGLTIVGIIILIGIITVQIGKVSDLATELRGEEYVDQKSTNTQARWFLVFLVVFLILTIGSAWYYKNQMLGYGPNSPASAHGGEIDSLFNMTLFFTGIVFVLTHIALFWFVYKYRREEGRTGVFFSHDNKLEIIWTIIPAIVMVVLVANGLSVWNKVMADIGPDEEVIEFEATGYQFAWDLRYPGPDGRLGKKNFRLINGANNVLGQDWTDMDNIDDFMPTEIYLPVNKKVKVNINAKDVLHNFYLPQFRLKMDAVPGLPTFFVFTPITTTAEFREELSQYPEWQVPADPDDPNGPQRWELFDYELACAELCGEGHYSMRRVLKVVTEEEYETWLSQQTSYYAQNVRNTDADPYKGRLLPYEAEIRAKELTTEFEAAIIEDDPSEIGIRLSNVFFNVGSADLKEDSQYELDHVAKLLTEYDDVDISISGHTDNTGDADANMVLSNARANAVKSYLIEKGVGSERLVSMGYGQTRPADTNDTVEGRQNNRRIEMNITSQNIN